MKQPTGFRNEAALYSAMTVVAQALAFVSGIVSSRLLGPTNIGLWNGLLIALTYTGYLDFGIRNGVARELPILVGKEDAEAEKRLRDAGLGAELVIAAASVAVPLAWAQIVSQQADPLFTYGLRILAVTSAVYHIYAYFQTLCRSYGQFTVLGIAQIVFSGMGLIVGIPMIVAFALPGRMWTHLITLVVCLIVIVWRSGIAPRPQIYFARTVSTARIGLPILAAVVASGFLSTVDRVLVGSILGARELGFFAVGTTVAQYSGIISVSLNEVLYPRMAQEYGKNHESPQSLLRLILRALSIFSFLASAISLIVCLLIPGFIYLILPDFAPSILVAQISVLGSFFGAVCGPAAMALIVLNKRYLYLLLITMAVILNVGLDYVALHRGWGIVGIAITGPIISWLCYSVALISAAAHFIGMSWAKIATLVLRIYAPIVYVAMVVLIANWLLPFTDSSFVHVVRISSLRLPYLGLVGLPLAWWSNREIGWVGIVRRRLDSRSFLA